MSFNFFTTKRVFRIVQYDGIDHFVALDLSGEERLLVQLLIGEFHSSAICQRFNPLVAHSAPQVAIQSRSYSPQTQDVQNRTTTQSHLSLGEPVSVVQRWVSEGMPVQREECPKLTIMCMGFGALFGRGEKRNQPEKTPYCPMPNLWCRSRKKVRTHQRPATHRSASRPPIVGSRNETRKTSRTEL